MPKLVEMDQAVTLADQLKSEDEAVVLINTFVVPPSLADALLAAWSNDAGHMKAPRHCWKRRIPELRRLAVGRPLSRGVRQSRIPGAPGRLPGRSRGQPAPVPQDRSARHLRRLTGIGPTRGQIACPADSR
jgi:hypothetical protein